MQFSADITQWIRSFGQFIYNRQDHRILGRDGKQWSMIQSPWSNFYFPLLGKLAAFYFFFYVTLGGLFCLYLAVFMSFLPLNQPRYVGQESQITSRGHPLSPGWKRRFVHVWIRPSLFQDLVFVHRLARIFMMYKHWLVYRQIMAKERVQIVLKSIQKVLMISCTAVSDENNRFDQRTFDYHQIIVLRIRWISPLRMSMIVNRTNSMVLQMGNRVF